MDNNADVAFAVLGNAMENLTKSQTQINEKVDKLSGDITKQQVLLAELVSVHKRLGTVETAISVVGDCRIELAGLSQRVAINEEVLKERTGLIKKNETRLASIENIPNRIVMQVIIVSIGLVTAFFGGHFYGTFFN